MAARLLRRVVGGERRGENGWIKNLLRKARNYPGRRAPEGRVHSFFADNVAVGSGHFLHPLAEVAVEGGRPCTPLYIWLSLEGEGAGVIKLGRKLAAALAKLLSLAASIQPLHGLVSTIRSERFDGCNDFSLLRAIDFSFSLLFRRMLKSRGISKLLIDIISFDDKRFLEERIIWSNEIDYLSSVL